MNMKCKLAYFNRLKANVHIFKKSQDKSKIECVEQMLLECILDDSDSNTYIFLSTLAVVIVNCLSLQYFLLFLFTIKVLIDKEMRLCTVLIYSKNFMFTTVLQLISINDKVSHYFYSSPNFQVVWYDLAALLENTDVYH